MVMPAKPRHSWPAAGGHRVVRQVGLEEQRLPARRPDRPVDLEQLAVAALVPVLRPVQVADLGVRRRRREHVALLLAEGERRADDPRLVGVDDRPSGVQIFTRTTSARGRRLADRLVQLGERPRDPGTRSSAPATTLGEQVGRLGGDVDRLALGDLAAGEGAAAATTITTAAPAITWISTVRVRSGRSGGARAAVPLSLSHGARPGTPG